MKFSKVKAIFSVGVVGVALTLLTAYSGGRPTPARAADGVTPAQDKPSVAIPPARDTVSVAYAPGTLVKGSDHFVYYITGDGTRRPIYDWETFTAFGFKPEAVITADQELLDEIPLGRVLTRLVIDDHDNLFWVMNGQKRQVNPWKQALEKDTYQSLPTSPLDYALAKALPTRVGLINGSFVRQDGQVYYHVFGRVTPVRPGQDDQAEVIIDVPAGVLEVYTQQEQLKTLFTRLKKEIPAANLRSGPGIGFEVIGTVYVTDKIAVYGRAENSYWLQVRVGGQIGWLAGDLVKDQGLLSLLPKIDTSSMKPQQVVSQPEATANMAKTYTGVGLRFQVSNNGIEVMSLVEDGPAERAGLMVGDTIIEVDGRDITDLSSYNDLGIIGPKDTQVTLTVIRSETNQQVEIPMIRDLINLNAVAWTCDAEPIRGFGQAWRDYPETHKWLGCPFTNFRRNEHATAAAVQTFEHGWMLWLETDTVANVDPIYVFFEDDGSYIRYGDRPLVDAHSYAPTDPGFYKVGDRFAKVYWEEIGPEGRSRLGRATNEAGESLGAFQEFERGRMFWAGEADIIYVIYQGDFDFDGDGETTYIRAWTSYEDTFEAPDED